MVELAAPQAVAPEPARHRRQVGWWLVAVAVLVLAMVVLGGVTRLTNSGLSMVEWRPVTGWLPPLSEDAWQGEFDRYKQFPEYQKLNRHMELAGFKRIYWFEFLHRLLGRLIGVAFLVPLVLFAALRRVEWRLVPRLGAIFLLGGVQGALGWFMVQSGLVDRPDVSHLRLTAHLGLAVLIFGLLLWTAFGLLAHERAPRRPAVAALALIALIYLQLLSGGLVAGLDAGFAYNTWPLMAGALVPDGLLDLEPWWRNCLENVLTVQFQHRLGAYVVALYVLAMWWRTSRHAGDTTARGAADLLLQALILQAGLGIVTLLYGVPVALGALHQAGALLLFAAALYYGWRSASQRAGVAREP
jgi:cytochrome c oxidase assembly protein subunit 15